MYDICLPEEEAVGPRDPYDDDDDCGTRGPALCICKPRPESHAEYTKNEL